MERWYFVVFSIIIIFVVIWSIKKKSFSISESFWWVVVSIVMLILSIFPGIIDALAAWMHIEYPPSLLFVLSILFLLSMVFRNSKRISQQQEKIIELEQQIVIVKGKIKEK